MATRRPLYFIRVNGIAASRDMSGAKAELAAQQAIASRPDAVIELVQIDRASGTEVGSIRLHSGH